LAKIEFFDVNVTLGRPRVPKFCVVTDPLVMRAELAAVGIEGGLVRHTLSAEWHPTMGNPEVTRLASAVPGFGPVWAVLPHWTGEFPAPDELLREMSASGVRAVIMYPGQHGFPIRRSVTGPLFEALESARVMVLLPAAEVRLEVVEQVATDHPALPIVVSEVGHSSARELYPVFMKCPNVHIELSGYMVHRGIEDIVGRFGDGRVLFGTRYPLFNPGCAIANVMYANISDDARKSIASGNAKKLLAEVTLK